MKPIKNNSPVLLLVDGHSLAFRAYYAFAKGREGGLKASDGTPTSICFGFLKSLLLVLEAEKPEAVAIAFDLGLPTFRHDADATYKADRADTPDDFIPDLANLQEILAALNLQVVTAEGYEADDVLGTLATKGKEQGYLTKIVSGDRDLFQLIDDTEQISVLYLDKSVLKGSKTIQEYHVEEVKTTLKISPSQVVDYKALCGDKSDNIPGVKGIGEKTAVKLLEEYGSLHGIYEHLSEIKGATKTKLETGKADAEHSQYLAQIQTDIPLNITLSECKLKGINLAELKPLLAKLELKKFLSQLDYLQQQLGGEAETDEENEDESLAFFTAEETKQQQQSTLKVQPEIIDSSEKLEQLITTLKQYQDKSYPVSWDTETTGLKPRDANLVGIGCCWGKNLTDTAYIPVQHTEGTCLDITEIREALRPILESATYPKTLQNAKFDRLVFRHFGIQLAGVVFDTMLASYVLHPERNHNLSELAAKYLPELTIKSYQELEIAKNETIADLDIKTVAEYCGMDAYVTYQLTLLLAKELEAIPPLDRLLRKIEIPLEPILAEMEYWGIRIDTEYLQTLSNEISKQLEAIESQTYELAGETFNLNSPKQLSHILFEKLNLNRKKSRKTKTGYSTNHAILEKLQGDHPIIDLILSHRTLSKLKSTYVDALPNLVNPETQRIYTDFNQAVTTTGRLSSSNPNLQNIPIRTEFSRQIRRAFLPKKDWLLVAADYSQIELRILTHFSQEPILLDAYQTGKDVHEVTAKLLFEKEEITAEERRLGKTINFGVIYGMGAQRFAREAAVSNQKGKEFIDKYHSRYPQVFAYLERQKKSAIALGYVETIMKRRRYFYFNGTPLEKLKGSDPDSIDLDSLKLGREESETLRAAANAPIQGSSADIIKLAMVKLGELLASYQSRLLLQVHDELVFEIHPEEWEELRPKIKTIMEETVSLKIPLEVEISVGKNWMEAK
ncbi:DNA polymerase I [Euhalothece natronophila Z-M001]|uniref:DNA polymerase I n=1 Tax=Euhalothece natronophila Z-M001 TaxID=522448 RepID=A0A5B8NKL8_9CHRO|nr:DNA polymerase I [Euhalothece natronophila]QDZ39792.1 DNA polymerase I [Euhalothece natronophila Z-M001]